MRISRLGLLVLFLVGCSAASASPRCTQRGGERYCPPDLVDVSQRPTPRDTQRAAHFAEIWDAPERDTWQRPAEAIALLRAEPGQVVVDLGTGTGYFLPFLSVAVGDEGRVLALDTDPEMIAYVQQRAALEGMENVEARVVTASDPGLARASVDRVLVVDTWNNLPDRTVYAVRLREALRPGGTLLVIDFTPNAPHGPPSADRIAPETVALDLTNAGFQVEVLVEGLLEQYAVRGTVP